MTDCSELTVADVYEHAALIGKDIEIIVSEYGKEIIEDIMPKIVFILEKLEGLVEQQKSAQERVQQLMIEREQLTIHTKRDEAIQRQMSEKLAYLEELLFGDKKELETKMKRLREENECLCEELDKREEELVKIRTNGALPGDVEVMVRMKGTIDSQRDQLRLVNGELQGQKREIEAIQEHSNRVTDINELLRRSNLSMKARLKRNGIKHNDNDDIDNAPPRPLSCVLNDDDYDVRETSLLEELQENDNFEDDQQIIPRLPSSPEVSPRESMSDDRSESPDKDPNRPRYTLSEMQMLLEERNLFKIKMMALEEELELFKSGEVPVEDSSFSGLNKKPGGVRNLMAKFLGK